MSERCTIVIGNEKGGAGKSTVAVHLVTALLHEGARVAVIDLDTRQQSTGHFFANRVAWVAAEKVDLPMPAPMSPVPDVEALKRALDVEADFVVIDTPGADTELSKVAHGLADLIVTPMNDSFVDFDVLGALDPVSLEVTRPSLYALTVWEARNRRRVDERVATLARRVGFRPLAGLRDRVIYRELFPFGLTVSDLSRKVRPVEVSLSHVSARQELRVLMHDLGLVEGDVQALAAE